VLLKLIAARMNDYFAYFNRQSRIKLLAIGYLMVVVIFGLDYVTGVEFTFSIFYLIAVFFVAWFVGKAAGAVISLVSATAWLLADVLVSPSHLHPIFSTWNAIGMSGFFLIFDYLLVAFKNMLEQEKLMARKIQLGLLPKSIAHMPGYEIATAWEPADTVAGDYFYGLLDTETRSLVYVNAGHNQPVLMHCDGSIARLNTGGIPLGLKADRQYQQSEVKLRRGDRLVLFTDGLIECFNFKNEAFGQERLLAMLCEHRQLDAAGVRSLVMNAVAEFCQSKYLDDLTLVVMAMVR
jgi:hypothetical protein